jgi:hypothetical protein
MASALMTTFLEANMRDVKTSVALYAVSSDVDGAKIVQETGIKCNKAVVGMLKTGREESTAPEQQYDILRQEMISLACAYLNAKTNPGL